MRFFKKHYPKNQLWFFFLVFFIAQLAHSQTSTLLKDIQLGSSGSDPRQLTNVGGKLVFTAKSSASSSLWRSLGRAINTTETQPVIGNALEFTNFSGATYYVADNTTSGYELWRADANGGNGSVLKDINEGVLGSMPTALTVVGNTLFFVADDAINGAELWKTDGTANGTVLVKNIAANAESSNPLWLTEWRGSLYFVANSSGEGYELWKSDGTEAGTVLLKDIRGGPAGSFPKSLTKTNNFLYFVADDGVAGNELWRTDGTTNGTTLVQDIWQGNNSSSPYSLTAIGDDIYFAANDGTNGFELWKATGSQVVMVANINSGSKESGLRYLTNAQGTLYFVANNGANGLELWKSNGTSAGTNMVADIMKGAEGSEPRFLTNIGGWVYFVADNGLKGDEFWKSNGTAATTVCVKDIYEGPLSSLPNQLTAVGDTLYAVANDGVVGREVWKFDPCRLTARIPNKVLLTACASTQMTIKGIGSNCPDVKYEWSSKPAGIMGKDSTLTFTVPITIIAKKYRIYYKIYDETTTSIDSTEILVMPHTPLSVATRDTSICSGQELSLPKIINNYSNFFNQSWNENSFSGTTVENPELVKPSQPTTYFLTAITIYGCVDTTRIVVRVGKSLGEMLQVKVLLGGPYNSGTGLMATDLNKNGLLPGQNPTSTLATQTPNGQPYSGSPWYLPENKTINTYPTDVVDWVYVSVRTQPEDPKTTIFRTAALLKQNGSLISTNGCTYFSPNQPYYVGIDHRNHLGAVSHKPATYSNGVLQYDFTTQQSYIPSTAPAYGQQQIGTKFVLYAGDMRKASAGEINADDTALWRADNGKFGKYLPTDANMDGQVNALDNNIWLLNKGIFSRVRF